MKQVRRVKVSLTPILRAMVVMAINARNNPPGDIKVPWENIALGGRAFELLRKEDFDEKTLRDVRQGEDKEQVFKLPVPVYNFIRRCFQEVDWWRIDNLNELYEAMLRFGLKVEEEKDDTEVVEGDAEIIYEEE